MWGKVIRTILYLKPSQIRYQVRHRLIKPGYVVLKAPDTAIPQLKTAPISKPCCVAGDTFTFLNREHRFAGWGWTEYGMLWAYNQNYFDWINQDGITPDECCTWIDRFVDDLQGNRVGLDPYPIALRSINWIKFFCRYPDCATRQRLDSLYSQISLLELKLEYHLQGNHLLEDAYALYIGARFFADNRLLDKARKLLRDQLQEQILPDGAHYEQSPMYHCILLDRLLDCINMAGETESWMVTAAERMLGHLESVIWSDGTIPLLNDSAYGIAPAPEEIFDYARCLGLQWSAIPMKECGYRRFKDGAIEAIMDIGKITAAYQPGHTHADIFSYELRIDGKPVVVDTGISTYDKNGRRQYERSTAAHNTVSADNRDSIEVWGGFRVGRRASVYDISEDGCSIKATHNGFGKPCTREFLIKEGAFTVTDCYDGDAVSYIHLAEGADAERITVEGAVKTDIKPCKYSTAYNRFHDGKVMEIHFKGKVRYTIQ